MKFTPMIDYASPTFIKRNHFMKRFSLAVAFVAILSAFVSAQKAANDYDKGEVFVGYSSHVYVDDPCPCVSVTERGFDTSGVYNFHRYWGVKADASVTASGTVSQSFVPGFGNPTNAPVSYKQRIYVSTFTAGVQLKNNSKGGRFKPFAHALFGVGRLQSKVTDISCTTPNNCTYVPPNVVHNGFAVILGVGLDINVSKRIAVRAAQLDLSGITGSPSPSYFSGGSNDFRFAAGVVFKF